MREHFHNLQALRGVACLLVVVYHVACQEKQYGLAFNPLKPVLWFGYAGVDLFFVLSGFIIAATARPDLGRPGRLPQFAFRRFWRIYPTYWAALALAVVHFTLTSPDPLIGHEPGKEALDNLLLLPQTPLPRFLAVAWSLSYELMFYLAFAALFLLPRRAAGPLLIGWAGVVVWAAFAGTRPENRFAELPLSNYVLEFLLGVLIAWRPVRLSSRQCGGLVVGAAAWLTVGSVLCFNPDPHRLPVDVPARVLVFGMPAALLVFAAVGWERAGVRLGGPKLKAAGDASYSIYLIHCPVLLVTTYLSMLVGWPHNKAGHVVWLGAMIASGVGCGLLLHRCVERPLLNLVKRTKPTPPAREVAAPLRNAA